MNKYFLSILCLLACATTFAQNKATIAVEAFRFQPVSRDSSAFVNRINQSDLKNLGESFSATFTEKLRKAGYTVVTRKNIDSLLDENRLGQIGLSDDEGTTKLRSADLRIIGTIRQFEQSEKSDGAIGVLGAVVGRKTSQIQGIVEVVVELISRDGTVIASSSGKSTKYGRINDLSGVGAVKDGVIGGLIFNSTRGGFSDAISNASSSAIEFAVGDLAKQLKKIDLQNFAHDNQSNITKNFANPNFNKARVVVAFPESQVAEEVFTEAFSNSNARVVLSSNLDRNIINNKENLINYCNNIKKTSGNARFFVFGTIDQEKVDTQAIRISMSIRVIDLNNLQLIHSDSRQGSVNDLSLKAGYDRVCKQTAQKLVYDSFAKIHNQMNQVETNNVYTLEISGFQSLSSANRFLNLLKKNNSVESTEVIDFQNQTMFAEIKFNNTNDISSILERDSNIIEMFSVNVLKIQNNKIQANVIVR